MTQIQPPNAFRRCVCQHVYTHIQTHTHTHTLIQTHTYTHTHTHTHTHTRTHAHTHTYTHTHIHTHTPHAQIMVAVEDLTILPLHERRTPSSSPQPLKSYHLPPTTELIRFACVDLLTLAIQCGFVDIVELLLEILSPASSASPASPASTSSTTLSTTSSTTSSSPTAPDFPTVAHLEAALESLQYAERSPVASESQLQSPRHSHKATFELLIERLRVTSPDLCKSWLLSDSPLLCSWTCWQCCASLPSSTSVCKKLGSLNGSDHEVTLFVHRSAFRRCLSLALGRPAPSSPTPLSVQATKPSAKYVLDLLIHFA
jgi:hypothetical protein